MAVSGIIDGTLREGDQAPGVWLDPADKLRIFHLLDAAGVAVVDAGMPAISEGERALLRALSAVENRRARVAASVRALPEEIALAQACGVDEVFVIFPVSALHRERLGVDLARWRRLGEDALAACRRAGLTANLVLEDASRADPADLTEAVTLGRRHGADRLMICDTVGVLTPSRAQALVRLVREAAGAELALGTHFHDDFGMATANTLAAVEAGAHWPSVTVNGVGERAGNAPLAEVAAGAALLLDRGLGIDLQLLTPLAEVVEAATGVLRAPNAPVVGAWTFDHESGIHVHGVLKDPRNYEPLPPEAVGRARRLRLGKHTGRAGLSAFAHDRGLPDTPAVVEQVLHHLKESRPEGHTERIERVLGAVRRYLDAGAVAMEAHTVALFRAAEHWGEP